MSQHTNNTDCSVTVVKLAGYNGDDHFLLLMLKGAGGLADLYCTTFLKVMIVTMSVLLGIWHTDQAGSASQT